MAGRGEKGATPAAMNGTYLTYGAREPAPARPASPIRGVAVSLLMEGHARGR